MAKQLILVRHAKSDWGDFTVKDFDRPLNERGHKSAPEMVERLMAKEIRPQAIVSSPALRAITTAKYFAATWKFQANRFFTEPAIYEATTNTLLRVVNQLDNRFDRIALFGHNPGLTDLLNYLGDQQISNMPTCGVAIIDFPFNDWKLVSRGTGELLLFDYPKSGVD
jgi:phosphohistidine phosphatase